MLIGGLSGIAVFEACSGVLMGAVLGLSSMAVSILFILPIPAAFFGAWFAGRPNKRSRPDVAVGDLLPAGGSDDVDRGCWAS